MKRFYLTAAVTAAAFALPAVPALAQTAEVTIGITTTTTGPAAALGIPERNALDFVPKEIGGVPLKVIVLDDGGDPTAAHTRAGRQRRLPRAAAAPAPPPPPPPPPPPRRQDPAPLFWWAPPPPPPGVAV